MHVLAHAPAADVEAVRADVADLARRGLPEIVPSVMRAIERVGLIGRRSEKQVPVQPFGDGGLLGAADAGARLGKIGAGAVHLAHFSFIQHFHGGANVPRAALVGAALHHAVVLARRFDHPAAFLDAERYGLLDVDILPGLASPDGLQSVPIVRCGDGDCINILAVEQIAEINHGIRTVAGQLLHFAHADGEEPLVDVA